MNTFCHSLTFSDIASWYVQQSFLIRLPQLLCLPHGYFQNECTKNGTLDATGNATGWTARECWTALTKRINGGFTWLGLRYQNNIN